jgi:selenocysteine lyase/cysteine desulfurase
MMSKDKKESIGRREFLRRAGAAGMGGVALGMAPFKTMANAVVPGPKGNGQGFWQQVSNEFILDPHSVYMNIGTTGSMPRQVLQNYDRYNRLVASDPWHMGGEWGDWPYTSGLVQRIAPQFGANTDEIVLSRNTTDGMCTIIGSLNLQPGDEVLYTHHEHVAAESPLYVQAQRHGVILTPVQIHPMTLCLHIKW